jgi:hypothetical protein
MDPWRCAVVQVKTDPDRYRSFLLRLWKEAPEMPWRYQVHCVATGEELRFAELEQVMAYLREVAGGTYRPEPDWIAHPQDARTEDYGPPGAGARYLSGGS